MAKRRATDRPRVRYRLNTWVFLFIFLMVELAAFNTSENLLYLLAAFALGFPPLALVISRLCFGKIEIKQSAPEAVHCGERFAVSVVITNKKRVLPAVSLQLAFIGEAIGDYLPILPARTSATLHLTRVMPRRGVHTLPPVEIVSWFPMGFVSRSRQLGDGSEIVVYPRVHRIEREALDQLDDTGTRPRPTLTAGDEFYSLREYVPGDDIRLISWRVSARLGELIVRELEPGSARSIAIVLDTRGVIDSPAADEGFELAVELAASIAVAFLDRQYSVALVTPQGVTPLGQGEGQIVRILDLLARAAAVSYAGMGDDWYRASGDMAGATKLCVATDRAQWGGKGLGGSVRVLDPQEVLSAS
jgi:uncharacterized protein (DUF58 family)